MIAASLDDVLALYDRFGADHYDEDLSQLAHAEQTAALAAGERADDALIAAALLHDVGHLLYLAGDRSGPHEDTGVAYLAGLFPAAVLDPIARHVDAKRALCALEPGYYDALSDGSKRSLARQGGPMSAAEAAAFRSSSGGEDGVRLRRWDDGGKVDGLHVRALRDYTSLLSNLVV